MSLTSELAIPSSPVTKYLKFVGTLFVDSDRGAPWAEQRNRLLGLDAPPPTKVVPTLPGSDAGMVGTAFDYRLRYHFATCQAKQFVAWKGASLLTNRDPTKEHGVSRFFSISTLSPHNLSRWASAQRGGRSTIEHLLHRSRSIRVGLPNAG